jgi:hypothetical protein
MDNPFFHKRLKRAVNSNAVESLTGLLFDISVRQCAIGIQEQLHYFLAAFGYAQMILL